MAAAPDAWLAVECDEGGLKHRETPGEYNIFFDALGERPILLVRVNVDTTTTKPALNNWLGQTALCCCLDRHNSSSLPAAPLPAVQR